MLKAVVFVDADWLCASTLDLSDPQDISDLQIDHRRLGSVLADEIGRRHHVGPIDVVRNHYFASRPRRAYGDDQALLQRRRELLARLEGDPHVELEMVDLAGGSRSVDRDDRAGVASVPVALTVTAMRYALTPGVLDLAIVVLGDAGFAPLLRELRRLGKRVALVSIEGSCARELVEPAKSLRVWDFEVVWLNDVLGRIEKWHGHRRLGEEAAHAPGQEPGASLRGRIKNVIWDRGYGFIAADDGRDYFFHINALEGGLEFDELQPDLPVSFEVKSGPIRGRAGAARVVRRDAIAGDPAPIPEAEDSAVEALPLEQVASEEAPSEPPPPGPPDEAQPQARPLGDEPAASAGHDPEESRS
jgi:cold shock CspA family protein